jgi:acetyl coenzyme A synthetase (ADP forming)-like protein
MPDQQRGCSPGSPSTKAPSWKDKTSLAMVDSLRPFFEPCSVAIVGVSHDPGGIGFRLLDAVLRNGFQGPVYPINPKFTEIAGLRTFPSVRDVPGPVGLAIIAVPRQAVLQVVEDCAARGIRNLLVISAGFAEVGPVGVELQGRLVETVRRYGMRMIGPNCLGLLSTDPGVRLNATFVPVFPPRGRVAVSSDSGAIGLALLVAAARLGLGISSCVSVGNRADVSSNDLLEYWEHDDATAVILLYLESFGNPRRFARIARRVGRLKPIVAMKAGRTPAGRRAAGSHTAALAASDVAVEALFRQTGVIRVETLEEMFDLAAALESQPLLLGRRIAILTNAGGPATLCADMCEAGGLIVPEFSETMRRQLTAFLPAAASVANPVDMIASATPDQFHQAILTILGSPEVEGLIVIYVSPSVAGDEGFIRAIGKGVAEVRSPALPGKPVLACTMTEANIRTVAVSEKEKIPCYAFPEEAARAFSKVANYTEWRSRPDGKVPDFGDLDPSAARVLCAKVLQERGPGWLSAGETHQVLHSFHFPLAPAGLAGTAEEAVVVARTLGFPVAVKLASRHLVHKTEVGGVRLGIQDEASVRQAFDDIRARWEKEGRLDVMEGVLVQPMIEAGVEVMVGMTEDPLFGAILAFGLGGIHIEILGDVCFRVAPLTDLDAAEMVRSIRGHRLLMGYRGHPPADVAALEAALLRVSRLVEEVPDIRELDLNPIFALPPGQGCRIADARIWVGPIPETT